MKTTRGRESLCITNYAASVTGIAPLGTFLPVSTPLTLSKQKRCYRNIYRTKLDKSPFVRHNYSNTIIIKGALMKEINENKLEVLKKYGSLNLHAEKVRDALFLEEEFFDPNDLVQTKYEMLRSVAKEGKSVTDAASKFGFSRLSYYRIKSVFDKDGLMGLVPKQRGPKHAHKLSDEIMEFVDDAMNKDNTLRARKLKNIVKEKFGIVIHHRSIERALAKRLKKNRGEERCIH
ncbi:MAG: helix-turn-helix domain containing protein [Victivallaceae bacterium]|nr:helix-turn-helix domain containing protein [Victivallaceae bacterium]